MPVITLKAGREKSLIRLHPWIFSGAIDRIEGDPAAGAVVDVYTGDGVLIGRGGYSPASQIAVRMWSFVPEATIDREFLQQPVIFSRVIHGHQISTHILSQTLAGRPTSRTK